MKYSLRPSLMISFAFAWPEMLPPGVAKLTGAAMLCITRFPDDEGPHVSIAGVYHGDDVFVQVLAYAPDDEEPGMKLDVSQRQR
jgi:hypothetical protein